VPDTITFPPTPEREVQPGTTLFYDWPWRDLAFAPPDEARLCLRQGRRADGRRVRLQVGRASRALERRLHRTKTVIQ
jgi:hypothetical protein